MPDEEAVKITAPKPNIRWVGLREANLIETAKDKDGNDVHYHMFVDDQPPTSISIGAMPVIELPSAEQQIAGFYSDQANLIVSCMMGYKLIVEK